MIVIDANIATKWYLPEIGTMEAVALQQGPQQLFSPDIIRLEVAAAITKRVRVKEKPIEPKDAIEKCEKWFRLLGGATITLIPEADLLSEAVKLSAKFRHSLQDCLYLAAAQQLNTKLITADRVLFDKCSPHFSKMKLLIGTSAN